MTAPNAPSPPEDIRVLSHHVPDADLKAYTDGELGRWGRLRVQRHLGRCSTCREEIERMERLTQNLRAFEPATEPLSAGLRARLIAAANTPAPAAVFSSPPLWRRRPLLTLGASGAIAAAALYLVALPRLFAPLEQRGAAESAGAAASAPAGGSARPGAAFKAAPFVVAAAPTERASAKAAAGAERTAAPRSARYAVKVLTAPPQTGAAQARAVSAAADTTQALRLADAARNADRSAALGKDGNAVLLKNAPVAARRGAAITHAPLRQTTSDVAPRPVVEVPVAAAALPPPATQPAVVAGAVSPSALPLGKPAPERAALMLQAPPREVVLAVAPGRSAATREAVVALVRSAGGSFEEKERPGEAGLGLNTPRADRRLDVRLAPDRVETLLADMARLNVQAVPAPAKSRAGAAPTATLGRSVADANSGRDAVKPTPQVTNAPALNGGGFGGAPAPAAAAGRSQNNAVQDQAVVARKEQRVTPARAALTIRIIEKAMAAPPVPAVPNSAGRQAP